MKVFYTDRFVLPLPPKHRFPMEKYSRLRRRVAGAGLAPAANLRVPHAATDEELTRAHTPAYVTQVQNGTLSPRDIRQMGFPWTTHLPERSRRSVGATIEACRAASIDGVGVNLAGGTHHAFADRGQGFCIFNDSVVAARAMQVEMRAERVLIIDCDVHQGNGTAALCADDPTIFTFSIHGARNFPFRKETSDLDVPLDDGTTDADYLAALERGLEAAFHRAAPDLAIYLAGADPFEGDTLGRLAVSKEGLAKRDEMVLDYCYAAGVPIAITMAGGYARDVTDTVDIHFQTVALACGYQRRRSRSGVYADY